MSISKYILIHPDHGTEAEHYDSAQEARSMWMEHCETVRGNIINRAKVYHMVIDDCPSRDVSSDWLAEIVEADRQRFNAECAAADRAANARSVHRPVKEYA